MKVGAPSEDVVSVGSVFCSWEPMCEVHVSACALDMGMVRVNLEGPYEGIAGELTLTDPSRIEDFEHSLRLIADELLRTPGHFSLIGHTISEHGRGSVRFARGAPCRSGGCSSCVVHLFGPQGGKRGRFAFNGPATALELARLLERARSVAFAGRCPDPVLAGLLSV